MTSKARAAKKPEMQKVKEKGLLDILKNATGKARIKFPEYLYFDLNGTILQIEIKPSKRNKDGIDNVVNYVCENMQTDNAAFEGWAICIKAWMSEKIDRVYLKWTIPESDNRSLHYNRFLYRVLRFRETYSWFCIDNSLEQELAEFNKKLTNLSNNFGNKEPSEPNSRGEKYLEYQIVHKYASEFIAKYKLDTFNHQLPVGVRNNNKSFFTGGASAIDLYGLAGDTISIFELKYDNKMVGIISELFLYSNIIRDMIRGVITPPNPSQCKRDGEIKLYERISMLKGIKAYMLSEKYHPLVDDKVITLMNNQYTNQLKIEYKREETAEEWRNL